MDMFFPVSNVALAMSWSLSCLGYLLCICLTWRFLPFLFIHVIPQLFGNRHGFGNFLEHNAVGGRCIFCLYKMFTTATKTHLDHPFRRHGMWNLWLKDFNASLFSIHTALTYAPIILIRVFVYTPGFVISLTSCSMFNCQRHRSLARCWWILLPCKVV